MGNAKYLTVEISGVITQIAKQTAFAGYTEGVIEIFLPDEKSMTGKEQDEWVKKNNKMMKAICRFMNENCNP